MKPILKLIAVNIALLFCLGPGTFIDFINANINVEPSVSWTNHSIYSFTHHLGIEPTGLYIVVLICLGFAYYRRNLLLPLTLDACLLPSISHDYKLSILVFPVAMFRGPMWSTVGIYFLYSITLFSYVTKPPWLANNLPVLFALLILSLFVDENANHRKT